MLNIGNSEIYWTGHAGFKIKADGKIIYVDPFKLSNPEPEDFILISHPHYDHCSVEDLRKICSEKTVVITVADCISKIGNIKIKDIKILGPGGSVKFDDIHIEAIRAYNKGKDFHPKTNNWIGFLVTIEGKTFYFAGDTDLTDEIMELRNRPGQIEAMFLPVGGTYTMNAEEAADAVNIVKPKIAVPMHFGSIVGNKEDAERFRQRAAADIHIMEKE